MKTPFKKTVAIFELMNVKGSQYYYYLMMFLLFHLFCQQRPATFHLIILVKKGIYQQGLWVKAGEDGVVVAHVMALQRREVDFFTFSSLYYYLSHNEAGVNYELCYYATFVLMFPHYFY